MMLGKPNMPRTLHTSNPSYVLRVDARGRVWLFTTSNAKKGVAGLHGAGPQCSSCLNYPLPLIQTVPLLQTLLEPGLQDPNQIIEPIDPHARILMSRELTVLFIRKQHSRRPGSVARHHIIDQVTNLHIQLQRFTFRTLKV